MPLSKNSKLAADTTKRFLADSEFQSATKFKLPTMNLSFQQRCQTYNIYVKNCEKQKICYI